MERRSRKKAVSLTKDKIRKYTYFLGIPLVVLVLVLVIVVVGSGNKEKDKDGDKATAGTESTAAGGDETGGSVSGDETGDELDLSQYQLKQDEIPELTALVQEYCQAKTDVDPVRLMAVFGRTDVSEPELEEERARMDKVSQMVEGYENITCYFVDGLEPASYVIYPYFEIQYKVAAMLMPSLTWSYVKRDGDGKFYMTQDVTDSEAEFIAKVSLLDSVKTLSAQVEAQAKNALEMDEVLREIYQVMGKEPMGGAVPEELVDETGTTCVDTPEGSVDETEPAGSDGAGETAVPETESGAQ